MALDPQAKEAKKQGRILGTLFDTSEEELIISVAFTFALLKAPALLSDLFATINTHFPDLISITYAYVALNMGAYVLLCGFAFHLFMRSAWVAFHGLHSVFPEGVVWDNIKTKPHQIKVMKEQWLTLEHLIIFTDKISSTVLALTMSFLVTALMLLMFCSLGSAVLLVLVNLDLISAKTADPLGFVVYAIPFIPKMLAQVIMQFVTLPEAGTPPTKLYRFWERCDRIGNMFMFLNISGTVPAVISSHFNRTAMAAISFTVMILVLGLMLINMLSANRLIATNFNHWESESPREIRSAAYSAERTETDWSSSHPFVDQRIQTQAYWQLHLPYFPEFEEPLRDMCPNITEASEDAEVRAARFIDCFRTYVRVQLNGTPLETGEWFFQQHGPRDLRTVSAVLPRELLQQGRNTLTIERGNPDSKKDPRMYYIHVWNP